MFNSDKIIKKEVIVIDKRVFLLLSQLIVFYQHTKTNIK